MGGGGGEKGKKRKKKKNKQKKKKKNATNFNSENGFRFADSYLFWSQQLSI